MTHLTLDEALAMKRKERGIRVCTRKHQAWIERARKEAFIVAVLSGSVTTDDLRSRCDPAPDPHVWGCVFADGTWEQVGWVRSKVRTNNGRMIRVWRLKEAKQ